MKSLPAALTPWRNWLNWFQPELAAHVGALVQRLDPLLGPFQGQYQGGEPEVEGLDDLRTRGSYERLLASEWLLAEEVPEEFLRRAASGEHVFLAPRPRSRRAERSVLALFDAGPLQLGAPRLAHLALWILLARRALQAGAELRWGVLHLPGKLHPAHTEADLELLLEQRSFALDATAADTDWSTALQSQQGGERWLIGAYGSRVPTAVRFTHRVTLQLESRAAALTATLLDRSGQREVRLPLSDAPSLVPLLRGTFSAPVTPQRHNDAHIVSLQRPPIIAHDGSRVALALRDEPSALTFLVPKNATDQHGPPRQHRWPAGYSAIATTFRGKRLGVLLADSSELRFWPTSMVLRPCPTEETLRAPGNTAAWLATAWLRDQQGDTLCMLDQARRLVRWDISSQPQAALQLVRRSVLGMAQMSHNLLIYAYHSEQRVWYTRVGAGAAEHDCFFLCEAPDDAMVLFGRGSTCAVRLAAGRRETWRISNWYDPHQSFQTELPEQVRVLGVMRDARGRSGMITMDRHLLCLLFQDGSNEVLFDAAPASIVTCTVCPNTALLALLTDRRQLIVISSATREVRLSVQTGTDRQRTA